MEENLLFPILTGMFISYIFVSFPTSLLAGKILKGIAQTKRILMCFVAITFFMICVVILLNHLNPV